ncbi:glycoside hydrolase family 9 protein [Actinorugispora endophytica]|uniref:Endoglucanase n=1 Tax=Actinorugispora endophytica TaxID=1605990 RepID=A0A4R6V2Q9_9ACTN|nr:glycoside hydrolase family 9 protein [Actinorugispora endophytica]TDQ54464.1 endoglucanase [Actinorugispora endophytica]
MSRRTRRRRPPLLAAAAAACAAALGLTGLAALPAHADPVEQIVNGGFDDGHAPWWGSPTIELRTEDGVLCAEVPGGTSAAWDVIIGQDDVPLVAGESYSFSFTASGAEGLSIRALVQQPVDPWRTQMDERALLTGEEQSYEYVFTSTADWDDAQVAFQIGGADEAWTFCVDDVSMLGGAEPPVYEPDTGPRVRVNQVGYLPDGPKRATVVTDAADPVDWELADSGGAVVARGRSEPQGADASSGLSAHTVDFGSHTEPGEDYTLTADGETSHPFDIGPDAYDRLRVDSLSFYYPQRSGVEILDSVAPGYGREAGHVGVAPNQGDTDVPCAPGTCDYSLDVSGGWYDAGDHGKYVVNGGISVHQLMSAFERATVVDGAGADALGDSTLRLPERDNGVPDVLDEARWEMEFLLKMQVPQGEPLAGMAHHKIHDERWTGLPLMPADDPQPRYLQPPSTAATLNLAATGAQCARLYEPYDADLAADCLAAAETAWAAAVANPEVYAPVGGEGGGPYNDTDVSDEFYWAAAELFLTTGAGEYRAAVTGSPLHTDDEEVYRASGFDWGWTAPLARLQLATVPNDLADRDRVRASVAAAADGYLAAAGASPWGLPYAPDDGVFAWGSNGLVLNTMVVMATAYDLTGDERYRDGVLEGMDYVLGRNALNQSYVTGYGENASRNQHSRWYADQLDPGLPNPPRGTLAGGPNSDTASWDPVAQADLAGCAPQFCYIDDIESWATNELTINWNAPLAWIASFVADQGGDGGEAPDPTPPSAPGDLAASDVTDTGASLSWSPATDTGGSGLAGYEAALQRLDAVEVLGTTTGTGYELTGLSPDTEYTFRVNAYDNAGNTSEPSTVTFTTEPGDTGGGASCAVAYSTSDWPGGFTGTVRVTNNGDAALRDWTLAFRFTAGQRISHGWSATWLQSGPDVTVSPLAWNAGLAPGATTEVGFNGTWTGANPRPTGFTLDGEPCDTA